MKKKSLWIGLVISLLILGLCVFLSLTFGARTVSVNEVIGVIFNHQIENMNQQVIVERIPRTIFGILAGMALAVSGALMQAITRNPIADPSILGVNTGAALSVVVGIAFFSISSLQHYILFAMIGAGITSVFVYFVGSLGMGGATPIKLALAGAATSAALSSLLSAVLLPSTQVMNAFRFWQVGSISGADWQSIIGFLPILGGGLILAFGLAPFLDVLALGDEMATGLGVNTSLIRLLGAISGVALCAGTTAIAGPIGFIGLMVPHAVRMIFGSSLKTLLPLSAISGANLLLLSDVIGRLLGRPGELEVGIVTAFIGAPILIMIARKAKVKAL